jgi:hypothetical protein
MLHSKNPNWLNADLFVNEQQRLRKNCQKRVPSSHGDGTRLSKTGMLARSIPDLAKVQFLKELTLLAV